MENQGSNDDNATISDVSVEVYPSSSSNNPPPNPDSQSNNDLSHSNSTEALAKALSSILTSLIKDFIPKPTTLSPAKTSLVPQLIVLPEVKLDQLLEDSPLPFIMQHAAKFSNVRKRVLSLNLLLKSIQWRVDNIDRMLSMGLQHGHVNKQTSKKLLLAYCLSEKVEVVMTRGTIPSIREDCHGRFVTTSTLAVSYWLSFTIQVRCFLVIKQIDAKAGINTGRNGLRIVSKLILI
ncbi:hypothetical protein CRYUN_Cryun03dG0121200 [Craigia yunnanensis]